MVLGSVTGASSGFVVGNGLSDFVNMSWDAGSRDGTPSPASALLRRGDPAYAAAKDIQGNPRTLPVDAGASERP